MGVLSSPHPSRGERGLGTLSSNSSRLLVECPPACLAGQQALLSTENPWAESQGLAVVSGAGGRGQSVLQHVGRDTNGICSSGVHMSVSMCSGKLVCSSCVAGMCCACVEGYACMFMTELGCPMSVAWRSDKK